MGVRISACRLAVPPRIQTNDELAPLIGRSTDWIERQTGVRTRHISGNFPDPAVLAATAARPVIDEIGRPDLILYAGAIPRQLLPDGSVFVQRELRLSGVPSFSVNSACLSFLTALQTASTFIEAGTYRRILICSAELASGGRNFNEPESAALLGDGAAAAMIEYCDGPSGPEAFRMETWSDGIELTEVRGGGVHRPPDHPDVASADHCFHMQGRALLRLTVPRLKRFLDAFLDEAGVTSRDIDLVVPHQPSGPGLDLLYRWGFDQRQVVHIISRFGNCVAASMPMALATALEQNRIQSGYRVLFLGTAAGISIGAALFRW